MKTLSIPFFVSVSLFSSVGVADWRSTTWGMTIEQARQIFPQATQHFSGKIFGRLTMSERIDGFEFDSWLTFNDGGLAYVELDLKPASDCAKLRQWAIEKYGKPTYTAARSGGGVSNGWLWQGDVIRLTHEAKTAEQTEICSLDYAKAPAPNK